MPSEGQVWFRKTYVWEVKVTDHKTPVLQYACNLLDLVWGYKVWHDGTGLYSWKLMQESWKNSDNSLFGLSITHFELSDSNNSMPICLRKAVFMIFKQVLKLHLKVECEDQIILVYWWKKGWLLEWMGRLLFPRTSFWWTGSQLKSVIISVHWVITLWALTLFAPFGRGIDKCSTLSW